MAGKFLHADDIALLPSVVIADEDEGPSEYCLT